MRQIADIAGALSDENRLRVVLALRSGELCLCHLIALLELAPSTVSKHLDVLHQAGLVERRKEGRWHHFRLAGREGPPAARAALRWVLGQLGEEAAAQADAKKLCCVRKQDRREVSACYRGR